MSDKEIQIGLMFIGGILTFLGFPLITPNVSLDFFIFNAENSQVLNSFGWALLLLGFPLFLFGMAYPYLEAWRKSRVKK